MKTRDIIKQLDSKYLKGGLITEIIEKLRQLEDLKAVLADTIDPLIEMVNLLRDIWEE